MTLGALMVLGFAVASAVPAQRLAPQAPHVPQCRAESPLVRLPALPEASGLAVSRRSPGRLYAHNDSGQPVLFALDARGTVTGRVQLAGAKVTDWEAVAVGPCGSESCLYVADIGDNSGKRRSITVYRAPEPDSSATTVPAVDVFHATYPDGAHDAEALFVGPDSRIYVVTKGATRTIALYRFPDDLRAGAPIRLERLAQAPLSGKPDSADRITDGAISPDGNWIVLRSSRALIFHRTADLLAGNWREAGQMDLKGLGEPQGEAVAFGPDNTIYVAGEGGGKSQAGTFARLTCSAAR